MKDSDYERVKILVLKNLFKHRYWGGRHTSVENSIKGIPGHLGGVAKKVVNDLIKERLLNPKITSYGLHVSLSPSMKAEIEEIISREKLYI